MPTFVHIDIPTDKLERAKKFYSDLFEWEFEKPFPEMDYYLFQTTGLDGKEAIGGGMGLRGEPDQRIAGYIGVSSIKEYAENIEKAGGKVLNQMPVPGWGYLAICPDTEGNLFGLWEENKNAK
ncbi:VOC family protein [Methanolobus psychrotolerans]|uniref:VOC family protein n=1 Tax=Methanolobus psychrotolerans TaxID=1874706 RepID=UPI000B91BD0E|nr:VOC family protein [Methanolobus psychrotolerans]